MKEMVFGLLILGGFKVLIVIACLLLGLLYIL
jgi:hypothetical protein